MSDRHATIESPVATKALEEVRRIVLDALSTTLLESGNYATLRA
jgi:hypothetical protein